MKQAARALVTVAILCAFSNHASAVSLVVTALNTTAVPGALVWTIGITVRTSDLIGAGANPVLVVQQIKFEGGAGGPVNATPAAANKADIQQVQGILDGVADNNSLPLTNAMLSANNVKTLYGDSWWYSGTASGTLNGYVDADYNSGTVTAGPFALGPINNVGSTGYIWSPQGDAASGGIQPANATTGQTMFYTGLFGPTGANFFDPGDANHVLGNELAAHGTITVPLAQIVATGEIHVPSVYAGGLGTFIVLGNRLFNVGGGDVNIDPGFVLPFFPHPEPSTWALAVLGAVGLAFGRRLRRQRSS